MRFGAFLRPREDGQVINSICFKNGRDPDDWKPMTIIGPGVREIRVRDEQGIFCVIYIAKFVNAVYVLHCFQKKTQKTSGADLEMATRRYKELEKEQSR